MSRIPLDLYAEVETASGTRYRWDANQAPGSRLRNFSFRTKIGEGFSDANGQLARRIDQDYPDLGLVNTVTLVGADGSVAYEGRVAAMPRELSDTHSIGVTLAGWMAHAKDKKFAQIFVDRDLNHWHEPRLARKAQIAAAGRDFSRIGWSKEGGALVINVPAESMGNPRLHGEIWYTAPDGVQIARVEYVGGFNGALTGWAIEWYASQDDGGINTLLGAPVFDGTLRSFTVATPRQQTYVVVDSVGNAFTATGGTNRRMSKAAVYGNHGITLRAAGTSGEPSGVYASDVIRWIANTHCPQLNTSGVQDTTYPIAHLAFLDRTFPYDAFLEVNKYHLWHLGVWENKTLHFRPYDLTDYQWEIRTDDPGTTFSPQGPSTEDFFNGIAVTYTDLLTGSTKSITPDDDTSLSTTSSTNPWNQHGIDHWDEITLSTPSTEPAALQLGAAALADRNTPKTPGTITCRGYIRDRAGNEQPVWKVRAGDTISVTNFPNDTPRLIVETDYNDEDKSIRLAIDRPFQLLEAYLDRQQNALQARGLM